MVLTLRLAPWRRGLRLLWPYRSVWWALVGVGAVLSLTLALPALYLGSTASASLSRQQAGRCAWTVGLQASGIEPPRRAAGSAASGVDLAALLLGPAGRITRAANARRGHLGPPVGTVLTGLTIVGRPGHDDEPTEVVYRDGGEAHVHRTSRVPGDGLLLTDRVAAALRVRAGAVVRIRTLAGPLAPVRVVGTYQDLADSPIRPFWCSLDYQIHLQDAFGNDVPPPLGLATRPGIAVQLAQAQDPHAEVGVRLERALQPGLRIDQGEQALAVVHRAVQDNSRAVNDFGIELRTDLPFLVERAHAVRAALTPPVIALALAAATAALGLAVMAGSFWAERRRSELELLSVRGVGPGALAVKAAVECAPPLLVGLVLGTGLAVGGVVLFGPAHAVPPASVPVAVRLAPAGWVLALTAVAVAVRRRRRPGRPARLRSASTLIWAAIDVLVLLATVVTLLRVSALQTSTDAETLPTFGLARLLVPLLVLVAAARLAARLGAVVLLRVRGRGDGWPVPVLLAVQRLAAVPRVATALALAVAVAVGTSLYAAGLVDSLGRTVQAKAQVFVGGDASIELVQRPQLPALPALARATSVLYLASPRLDGGAGSPLDVVAIDPTTFRRGAAWDPSFGSLDATLRALTGDGSAGSGRPADPVRAVAVGDLPTDLSVGLAVGQPFRLPLHVVARTQTFPGMRTTPFVVVSTAELDRRYPLATALSTERLWISGPLQPLLEQLRTSRVAIRSTVDLAGVSTAPALEAVLDALTVLRWLGVLAGVLAAVGLLVYADLRARQRRLATALTSRMGQSSAADWLASWFELGAATGAGLLVGTVAGLALAGYVSGLLDPVPLVPPRPVVVLPWTFAAGLGAIAVAGTALASCLVLRRPGSDAQVLRAE